MKVQIYSIKSPEDAVMCAEAGVNFIGVATGEKGRLKAEVDFATCRAIFEATPAGVTKNALTVGWDVDEVVETIKATNPDVIHLSGDIDDMPPEVVADVKRATPLVKIMQAIPVGGPETREKALAYVRAYQPVSDYFILDTELADFVGIGATGALHDWSISAEIVRISNVPVILAGGLSPENVADSIRAVRPFAVDSFTHTNKTDSKEKDPAKIKAFVDEARGAL